MAMSNTIHLETVSVEHKLLHHNAGGTELMFPGVQHPREKGNLLVMHNDIK